MSVPNSPERDFSIANAPHTECMLPTRGSRRDDGLPVVTEDSELRQIHVGLDDHRLVPRVPAQPDMVHAVAD